MEGSQAEIHSIFLFCIQQPPKGKIDEHRQKCVKREGTRQMIHKRKDRGVIEKVKSGPGPASSEG